MILRKTVCTFLFLTSISAQAAVPSVPYSRPSEKGLETPQLQPEKESPPEITLPPLPSLEHEPGTQLGVILKQVVFEGNTVFSDTELLGVVSQYLGKTITSGDLQQMRIELSKYYIDKGYINSGVLIPDQKVDQGIIRFRVVEGKLSVIQLSGQKRLSHNYIYDRILLGVSKPLNISDLQNQLFLLQQDQRIKRINAQLQPGAVLGESILYVDVEEAQAFHAYLMANNHRSPSVGSERGLLRLVHSNLTGMGDTAEFRYGLTEGLKDYYAYYDYPLTARDLKLSIYYEKADSEVIEQPFAALDVDSQSSTTGIGIGGPVYRNTDEQFDLGVNFEKRKSQTFLLGMPFSFEAGPHDGLSRLSVARVYQSWFKRSRSSVVALRSTFNLGFDSMDATVNGGNIPDGRFQSWLGQFQWLNQYSWNHTQLLTRATIQLTDDPLLPMEQFSVGGANSVRGYRENQLVGDYGFFASLEYRYPLITQTSDGYFQLVAFTDYGQVRNKDRATPDFNDIYSVGTGFRWAYETNFEMELYWGIPLHDMNNPDNDLQDDGIHFQLRMELY